MAVSEHVMQWLEKLKAANLEWDAKIEKWNAPPPKKKITAKEAR